MEGSVELVELLLLSILCWFEEDEWKKEYVRGCGVGRVMAAVVKAGSGVEKRKEEDGERRMEERNAGALW